MIACRTLNTKTRANTSSSNWHSWIFSIALSILLFALMGLVIRSIERQKINLQLRRQQHLRSLDNPDTIHCILGMAIDVHIDQFYVFSKSFRVHHPDYNKYQMYLFTDFNQSFYFPQYQKIATNLNITLVDLAPFYYLNDLKYKSKLKRSVSKLINAKYLIFNEFLSTRFARYNFKTVLLTQVDNVVFRENIFEKVGIQTIHKLPMQQKNQFWFFMEQNKTLQDRQTWYRIYLQRCFQLSNFSQFYMNTMSSPAVVLGTFDSMVDYVNIMARLSIKEELKFEQCLIGAKDQVWHNFLMNERYLERKSSTQTIRVPNNEGLVFHVASMRIEPNLDLYDDIDIEMNVKEILKVCNKSAVISQYQLIKELKYQYLIQYNYSNHSLMLKQAD